MHVRAVCWWVTLAMTIAACGGRQVPASTGASDSATSSGTAGSAPTGLALGVATTPARAIPASRSPNAFPHEKHRSLPCQRCHTAVPGHTAHTTVACSSCHAPVPVTGPAPTPDQCAACHHSETQSRPCVTCHAPDTLGTMTLTLDWQLSVWPTARQRVVNFDHRWHKSQPCAACHTNRPAMLPTRPCASCHVHHEGQVDCRACHHSPPVGVHTIAIHASGTSGCAGSGCHQNPPVKVATLSRDECLICHADRANHQPGKVCAQCHLPQPGRDSQGGKEPDLR
jgi:hypothetical protein